VSGLLGHPVHIAIKMLTQLNPPMIYAHSFLIFDTKTANCNCGEYIIIGTEFKTKADRYDARLNDP
jgi:hypothetical protein